jgi:predicted nucleic acid-binding protein
MAAAERFFVDTNVLLYSLDPSDPGKRAASQRWLAALWERGAGRLSWQVLDEFYVNAIRKMKAPPAEARRTVGVFAQWQPVNASLGLAERAWLWMDEAQLSYWDSLIVAAAERSGCRWLLSEDFQTGRRLGGVTVVDPFRQPPAEFRLGGS